MHIIGEFEILIILSISLLALFIVFNIVSLVLFLIKKRNKTNITTSDVKKISQGFAKDITLLEKLTQENKEPEKISKEAKVSKFKISWLKKILNPTLIKFLLINNFIIILFLIVQYFTFSPGESIVSTYPQEGGYWNNYEKPVEVVFNRPIRAEEIELYLSDDIEGEWEFEKSFPFLPFSRVVKFTPKESFFPDELIKIYVVNFNRFDIGEYPFNFYTAPLPNVTSVSPSDLEKDVLTNKDIVINLDKESGNYVDLDVKIAPEVEFEKEVVSNKLTIKPKEDLKQTTTYTVSIYRTAQTYDLDSKAIIKKKDKIKIHESTFSTIKAPLIESYSPEGTGIKSDAQIKVIFDEKMNNTEVENAFSITPQLEGEIIWEDERTFVFKPVELAKETKYTVLFARGISSESGGKTETEIKFEFETVGTVKVLSFSPANGFGGADINTPISVTFDQEVDKASAQSKFSINPQVNGTFTWTGNTMVFKPTTPLDYSTKYSVNVAPGVKTLYGFDSKAPFTSTFTTRSAVFILNIGHIYQQHAFGCNSTATAMVMNYKGVPTSEYQVYSGAGSGPQPSRESGGNPHKGWVSNYGVYWEPIAAYINSRGLSAQYYQNWNLTDALKEVEKGNPVIIWWQNGVSAPTNISYTASDGQSIHAVNGMHSVVIIGYQGTPENPTLIYYHDPYFGATRSRSPSSFDFLWSSWRMGSVPSNYRRVGLVVR